MPERAFPFLPLNEPPPKPRTRRLTEIRGPYYTPLSRRYLEDLLETAGMYVDSLKFAGGSFALMPRTAVKEMIDLAHDHNVRVSTGGFIERVLTWGAGHVDAYLRECRELGFDTVEISSGFIVMDEADLVRLVQRVVREGLDVRAEVGIQFGAGGATGAAELAALGTRDTDQMLDQATRMLDAGAAMLMLESEGVTENVASWRTDAATALAARVGLERVMFEAADAAVFAWYVETFGPDVNLFVDHSQIIQLEALRAGSWGPNRLWGRVVVRGG